jgi:hypothetical protein
MDNIWQQRTNSYYPGTDALTSKLIPPGLYRYSANPLGWWLDRTAERFEFPYKIYGNHDHILKRVKTAWGSLEGNLGVLLNGIKGTGKTVSAQLVANWAIDNGIPVLVVNHAIPLVQVLEHLDQPVVVIFDEFEKTHSDKDEQHSLLTALDGMARSRHKRMYIFTTNNKTVDDNFIDRPSRIRYCWEFRRLEDEVIEAILNDLLMADVQHFRQEILTYLAARRVLSIDVAKTVINEVNLFKEAPSAFNEVMNLSEQDAAGYMLEVLDAKREPVRTLSSFFTLHRGETIRLRGLLTRTGRDAYVNDILRLDETWTFYDRMRGLRLDVVGVTDNLGELVCEVQMDSTFDTWIGKYRKATDALGVGLLWLDERPEGWVVPDWAKKMERGEKLTPDEESTRDNWSGAESVFGTDKNQKLLIRVTPNYEGVSMKFSNFSLA